jgi:hypothetical protein
VAEATPPTEEWLEVDLDGIHGPNYNNF